MFLKITKPVYIGSEMILAPNQVVKVELEIGSSLIVMPTNGIIKARRVAKSHVARLSDMQEALYGQD